LIINILDFLNKIEPKKRKVSFLLFYLCIGILVFFFTKNIILSIFSSIFVYLITSEILNFLINKRDEILLNQLIELLVNMIIIIRAGNTVREAIKKLSEQSRYPIKKYLKSLVCELETGLFFDEAFDNFARRCSLKEAYLVVTAFKINNKIGGNIIYILNNIIDNFQQNFKSRLHTKTLTLQARYSGNIIASMPIIVLTGIYFLVNDSVVNFFQSKIGNIVLAVGCLLEILGILAIRKLLKFK